MNISASLGYWIRCRRRALDFTQEDLAQRLGCAAITLRKIEADERRPSRQIAERLADQFQLSPEERTAFLRAARAELCVDQLAIPSSPVFTLPDETVDSPSPRAFRQHTPASSSATQVSRLDGAAASMAHSAVGHNLPEIATSFIGRAREIAYIRAAFAQRRLVTLIGPGGVGKTRLALEVARSLQDQFAQGAHFVPLEELRDAQLVLPAIAQTLGITDESPLPIIEVLACCLSNKQLLLILDNCEHVLDGLIQVVPLLERAPQLMILATSRERLNMWSETLITVEGLPYPTADQPADAVLAQCESVQLFIDRASAIDPEFALTAENCVWIRQICRSVLGMPLAIELAASWVWTTSCEKIALGIDNNLDYLHTRLRDMPERHRNLRAVFEYSWELLSDDEQRGFARLAVFRGGFRSEAAAIQGVHPALLAELLGKSLVRRLPGGRYDLHDLLRQYAAEQLRRDPEECYAAHEQHLRYYLELAEHLNDRLYALQPGQWSERVEIERGNMAVALAWSCSQGWVAPMLRLSYALCRFWELSGYLREGCDWLMSALRLVKAMPQGLIDELLIARCRRALGSLYHLQGNNTHAWEVLERAYSAFTALQNQVEIGITSGLMGQIKAEQGHYDEADHYFEQQRSIAVALNNQHELRLALIGLSGNLYVRGCYTEAATFLEQALAIESETELDWSSGRILRSLGRVYQRQGAYVQALGAFTKTIALFVRLGFRKELPETIGDLGVVYLLQGSTAQAQLCLQRSLDLALEYGGLDGIGWGLYWQAKLFAEHGCTGEAADLYERAIVLLRSLHQPYLLYNALAQQAVFLQQQGQLTAAAASAQEAVTIARRHKLPSPIGAEWPDLLLIVLEVMLGRRTVVEAVQTIEDLRPTWTDTEQQAALAYTLWQIDSSAETARLQAAACYALLSAETPNRLYRMRYYALTGQALPDPEPLPELPAYVTQNVKALADILECINRAIPYSRGSYIGEQPIRLWGSAGQGGGL